MTHYERTPNPADHVTYIKLSEQCRIMIPHGPKHDLNLSIQLETTSNTVENLSKINGLKIKDPQSCGPKNHKIKTLGPANQHFHSNLVITSDPDVHLALY